MRRALVIGIDDYEENELSNCVNDAQAVSQLLEKNDDESPNFDVRVLINNRATKQNILREIENLFLGEDVDVAPPYFSGHGLDDEDDGIIVTHDYSEYDYGVRMEEILLIANRSSCDNKIIVLDCCKSGWMGKNRNSWR